MPSDRRLVRDWPRTAGASYTDLAERVGLSVSAVHQRVRRLEQRGVIRGYARADRREQLGLPLTAFVSVTPIDPARARRRTRTGWPGCPEIEACHSVAGVESYILKVRVE